MNFFWDNAYLSREERTRLLILLSIFAVLCIFKFYTVAFYQPISAPIDSHILDSVEMVSIKKKEYYNPKIEEGKPKDKRYSRKHPTEKKTIASDPRKVSSFRFNPNIVSKDSLLMLGFSNYAANSLMKYRSKGGVIRSIDQMSKINGLDQATLERLTPLVDLPIDTRKKYVSKTNHSSKPKSPTKKKYKRKEPKVFDINTGDTTDFMNLYGIGRVYSNRIINFRNSLGGFFTVEQIRDVWGIDDSLFLSMKPYLAIDPDKIKKRNINNMDRDSLNKHPYINWHKSKTILAYKKTHGDYQDMDEFYKLHLLEDEFVDTMKLYFVVK